MDLCLYTHVVLGVGSGSLRKMMTGCWDKQLGSNALKDLYHVSPIPSKRIHTH